MRAGAAAEMLLLPLPPLLMLLRPLLLLLLLLGEAAPVEAGLPGPEAGEPPLEHSRPYAVLKAQNLVLMGTVFGLLLVAMILMALCVYKPLRRR
uniref:Uncharacterized protein C12orf76 homolog n=1 Tax=Pogona vitticeps TaxID=103695 RepID=A0ABM5F2F9_9SAUR